MTEAREPASASQAANPPRDAWVISPRKPWLAGLLAACQGLGHIYGGRPLLGLGIHFVPAALFVLAIFTFVRAGSFVLEAAISLTILGVAFYLAQILWAVRTARRAGADYKLKRYNRVWVYVAFVILTILFSETRLVRAFMIEAFKIPAGSMLPTLEVGDQLFVTKLGSHGSKPQRGDLIVFRAPVPPHDQYIKRLVGMPGERVEIKGGVILIEGNPIRRVELGEYTLRERDPSGGWRELKAVAFEEIHGEHEARVVEDPEADLGLARDFGPVVIPAGRYFFLGDNRDHSIDSRTWGPIPAEAVIGRACCVYWSWGEDGLRSERIGLRF